MLDLQVVLLEHDEVEGLYPFTDTHCSWEIRTGLYTIIERWAATLLTTTVSVVSHRDQHVRSFVERHPHTAAFDSKPTLLMCGHVLVSPSVIKLLADTCMSRRDAFLINCGGHIVGAYIPQSLASPSDAIDILRKREGTALTIIEITGHVLHRIWHALDHIDESIRWDSSLVDTHIASSAVVHSTAVLDDSNGPIIIAEGVQIDALAVLTGPIAIGNNSRIKSHANLHTVALGPHSRIGGEVEDCIVQGWSNKQHDGFLGHSYLGEWVNLGAGTITSDLKNTYGHIRVTMPWGQEDTERTFLGLLMGDHSKCAIGTRFSTGTVCGVSNNIVFDSFPVRSIGSYCWMNEAYDLEKALQVMRTVMSRRNAVLGPETEALMRYLAR